MTQARRTRSKAKDPDPNTGVVTPPATGPVYLTAEYLTALGLTPDTAEAALADAQAVREQVTATPLIDQDALVQWAVSVWSENGAVDRLNAALDLAQRMGLIHRVG